MRRQLSIAVMLAMMVLLIHSGQVGAHAELLRADPAPGSTVEMAPKVVRVWFKFADASEDLDTKHSTISVWDSHSRRVDDRKGGVDLNDLSRRSMIAHLRPIGPGTYTVRWKAASTPDLDVRQGQFRFTVAAAIMKTEPLPSLVILAPANGAVVSSPVTVEFETLADLSKMTLGGQMMEKMAAHLHIDLDKRIVMPAVKQLTKTAAHRYRYTFGRVAPGPHTIRVYWADAEGHKPMGPVQRVTITVK